MSVKAVVGIDLILSKTLARLPSAETDRGTEGVVVILNLNQILLHQRDISEFISHWKTLAGWLVFSLMDTDLNQL